jgi:hypothetical protein
MYSSLSYPHISIECLTDDFCVSLLDSLCLDPSDDLSAQVQILYGAGFRLGPDTTRRVNKVRYCHRWASKTIVIGGQQKPPVGSTSRDILSYVGKKYH